MDMTVERDRFEAWWSASKYMQVVLSKDSTKQVAWDGWLAAYASILSSVRDEWRGEVDCCDAKGMWLVLSDDCPLVPGQHVTISVI